MIPDHLANFRISLLRLTRGGENDVGGDKSDAQCTYGLAERNNRHMDFRRTDNNGRTGADSTRKDSN